MKCLRVFALIVSVHLSATLAGASAQDEGTAAGWWSTLETYQEETGNRITNFNEAPMLAALVAKGKLPPVADRISKEPLVIANYDNEVIRNWSSDLDEGEIDFKPLPYGLKGWETSADGRILNVYLRRGGKWSDGVSHTADDIRFWGEVVTHPDLVQAGLATIPPVDSVEWVDEYTARIIFNQPISIDWIGSAGGWYPYRLPKHYLSKWHPEYNPDAERIAAENGFESWWDPLVFRSSMPTNAETPTVHPWYIKDPSDTVLVMERNPYFAAIDKTGQQLPYIDRVHVGTADAQDAFRKFVSGEIQITQLLKMASSVKVYNDDNVVAWTLPSPVPVPNPVGPVVDPVWPEIVQDLHFNLILSQAFAGENYYRAIVQGRGPFLDRFPELREFLSRSEPVVSDQVAKVQDDIIGAIYKSDPVFFDNFRTSIESGDRVKIRQAINVAANKTIDTFVQLNTDEAIAIKNRVRQDATLQASILKRVRQADPSVTPDQLKSMMEFLSSGTMDPVGWGINVVFAVNIAVVVAIAVVVTVAVVAGDDANGETELMQEQLTNLLAEMYEANAE